MNPFIILTANEMRAAEKSAIDGGIASAALMEKAGNGVAEHAMRFWTPRPTVVVCGPGNNGGDGFVAARIMKAAGWPVRVALIGTRDSLSGDAKLMADHFDGEVVSFDEGTLGECGLIIDAIFGTGLSRPVEGKANEAIAAMNAHPAPVLAIDLPSGVETDTGGVLGAGPGAAVHAMRTVTFHAQKPAHFLFPGRALCGGVDIVDIGISEKITAETGAQTYSNQPGVWGRHLPMPHWGGHKYSRGSVMVVSGGPLNTGAARLAARGALRIGAGAVTMLSPQAAAPVHAAHLTAIMLQVADDSEAIAAALRPADKIPMAAVIGPAAGIGEGTRANVSAMLKSNAAAVLDADALTSFEKEPQTLFSSLRSNDVLTPHGGEFARLFPEAAKQKGKLEAARSAANEANAVVVYKGADTVIAAPDGRALINTNAPPTLATAGSGDVLAGFIAGFRAQGMDGFLAAAAGVWFHGAAGQAAGDGLIAEDLPEAVPQVLHMLFQKDQPEQSSASAQKT
ncbi:NAD(P)H-hydrate dehydratase [Hyphococcus formosus]|uniref:NAD(P)H-hydrate dehydratase n=1 Tax=Hyphococcus formosus TaxID=3143534 RepID=UPI00398B85F3